MKIRSWHASYHARIHMLDKHDVWWDEVLSANSRILRGRGKDGERRSHVEGHTQAGRPLMVVFRMRDGTAHVITAFKEGH